MSSFQEFRSKTRGIYEPPGKLRQIQQERAINNNNNNNVVGGGGGASGDEPNQRQKWESAKKTIESSIEKIDTKCKIDAIFQELMQVNLLRGRGVFSNAIISAQQLNPKYTMHYTTIVALVNSHVPVVGELIIKRLIIQFKLNSKKLTNKTKDKCIQILTFIAHLINQNVAPEALAMEITLYLLDRSNSEAIEVLLTFLKECGAKLDSSDQQCITMVIQNLRSGRMKLTPKLQFQLEVFLDHRKDKFALNPPILPELDLVNPKQRNTHQISFKDKMVTEDELNFFKFDPEFNENESKYQKILRSVVQKPTAPESGSVLSKERRTEQQEMKPREEAKKPPKGEGKKVKKDSVEDDHHRKEELKIKEKRPQEQVEKPKEEEKKYSIEKTDYAIDYYHWDEEFYSIYDPNEGQMEEFQSMCKEYPNDYASVSSTYSYRSGSNVAKLRKDIRQAIQTTSDSEIGLQRLLEMNIPNSYFELCTAVVECCGQANCYFKYYGSLAQKLCLKDSRYGEQFVEIFKDTYDTVRDFEPAKIVNIAKLFADLLQMDVIPWTVLGHIRLKEDLIKSWHKNFIKILFQKLAEMIELCVIRKRLKDPQLEDALRGLFPRDNPQNAHYAIYFFTSIGLIDLTFDFRKKFKKK